MAKGWNTLKSCIFHGWLTVLLGLVFPGVSTATTVRLETVLGAVELELYDSETPLTVANFLAYVNRGAYDNSFIHRSVPGFVIQGGGYVWDAATAGVESIAGDSPVKNEFSASRSNLRGTIAMAKLGSDPDSATSQWFINLADNSSILDNQNGGFTVFGKVTGDGMAVVDAIAALSTANAGGAFSNLPLASRPASGTILREHLVINTSVTVVASVPATPDSDRVFNYAEASYPHYLSPAKALSGSAEGYYYRYYPGTQTYLGSAGGVLYYLGPLFEGRITPLGTLAEWLAQAAQAGY